MTPARGQTLTTAELNRAVLERQLLLRRHRMSIDRAAERVAGLQSQYAPSPYIRLWSSLEGFSLDDLTAALERRRVVQATLMRSTIHIVSAADFWPFAAGVGPSLQAWRLRNQRSGEAVGLDLEAAAATLRERLAGRVWPRKELDAVLGEVESSLWAGIWVPMVRVPPSGTWERRRADRFQLAEEWLGPSDADEERGLQHLLRRYLAGFGPSTLRDAASWAGVPAGRLAEATQRLHLRRLRGPDGIELIDLPRAPLPGADIAGSAEVHRHMGRRPPRPLPEGADHPRGVPPPHLPHQGSAVLPHVPCGRNCAWHLEIGAVRSQGNIANRAV